jgi:hypothetical protein
MLDWFLEILKTLKYFLLPVSGPWRQLSSHRLIPVVVLFHLFLISISISVRGCLLPIYLTLALKLGVHLSIDTTLRFNSNLQESSSPLLLKIEKKKTSTDLLSYCGPRSIFQNHRPLQFKLLHNKWEGKGFCRMLWLQLLNCTTQFAALALVLQFN